MYTISVYSLHIDQMSSHSFLTISIGILSLLVLLLPLDGESSSWPDWLHATVNMKLIASFVLGKLLGIYGTHVKTLHTSGPTDVV